LHGSRRRRRTQCRNQPTRGRSRSSRPGVRQKSGTKVLRVGVSSDVSKRDTERWRRRRYDDAIPKKWNYELTSWSPYDCPKAAIVYAGLLFSALTVLGWSSDMFGSRVMAITIVELPKRRN
jgi:hypothetical protein